MGWRLSVCSYLNGVTHTLRHSCSEGGLISHDDASLNTNAEIILVTFDSQHGAAFSHVLFHKLLFCVIIMAAVFLNVRLILRLTQWLNTRLHGSIRVTFSDCY